MSKNAQPIWFLNRGLVVLRPREPFITWVRDADPEHAGVADELLAGYLGAYLIPQFESDEESWGWIRTNASLVFSVVLNEWYTDRSVWPTRRDWDALQEWFQVEFTELVWDLVDESLSSDPDAPEHDPV